MDRVQANLDQIKNTVVLREAEDFFVGSDGDWDTVCVPAGVWERETAGSSRQSPWWKRIGDVPDISS
jgi:hypothetical protein